MPADERVFWRTETCTVWVGCADGGELVFNGWDRVYLDLVCARAAEMMARGERSWLLDRGIECGFISY